MQRELDTIFCMADQNNSGGYVIQNDEVNALVIVEGVDMEDCCTRFETYTTGNDHYCECCGERWWGLDRIKSDKEAHFTHLEPIEDPEEANCVIHFIDGTSRNVNLENYYEYLEDE